MHNFTEMKKYQIIIILLFPILIFSCKEKSDKNLTSEKIENTNPKVDIKQLQTDFIKWWTYHSYNISLSSDFIGINEKSDTIDKKQFLEKLTSGDFIPLRIKSKNENEIYKLYKLDSTAKKDIRSTIKNESLTNLKHFNMEGEIFPEFNFTDINGNLYTNENTKGKIIIIKTWFIDCKACIAEFPELNEFVEKYKNRNDIIFISLALDSKPDLEEFLKKKNFEYQVVPNKRKFIKGKLNLQIYPTHIILNKKGRITKVVNDASKMISFFENEKRIKRTTKNIPPPPPPAPM